MKMFLIDAKGCEDGERSLKTSFCDMFLREGSWELNLGFYTRRLSDLSKGSESQAVPGVNKGSESQSLTQVKRVKHRQSLV